MRPRYHIFLSYRRDDGKDIARTLKEKLVQKGYRVFFDLDELLDGLPSRASRFLPATCLALAAFPPSNLS